MSLVTPAQYELSNSQGMRINLMDFGATLTSVKTPSPTGMLELTLGFDTLAEYQQHPFYAGCTVGRVANRIAKGQYHYQNNRYELARNENNHCHLHGGNKGFDKIFWHGKRQNNQVIFSYDSPAGEENYPGNVQVKVSYELTDANELKIDFHASTDQSTPLNLTNHAYWNLRGAGQGNILNHELEIFAREYLETDNKHLPTGRLLATEKSLFDFNTPRLIGERIAKVGGYDHCFVTAGELAARVREPDTGHVMEVYTTQPGIQFYSGNYLPDYPVAGQKTIKQHGGFCLETQGFPDAVNQPLFPSVMLLPEQIYQHTTIYKFLF